MGLDQYINRFPRYKNTTATQINAIEGYLDWLDEKKKGDKCTLKEWCGIDIKDLPKQDVIDFYKEFYTKKFAFWDIEKKYGYCTIHEQVGYLRKANQIHNWFVKNIQDGIDDCQYHREVTKEDLEELLYTCYEVLCNPDLAELKLPTQCGFFFGSTDYDEWYIKNVKSTVDIITKILETTDFDKQMICYISSW